MNQDPHTPAFIRAEVNADERQPAQQIVSVKKTHRIGWHHIIKLSLILTTIACGLNLLSILVTPQVITVLSILIGFVVIRFIVRTILHITFTLLRYLFWIIVLAVILLCVL